MKAKKIIVYGDYGISESNILQITNKSLNVSLNGYNSGYNTNIYCLQDTQCIIECNFNITCNSTRIYYSNLDFVNVYPSTCHDNAGSINDDGTHCPYLIKS